MPCLTVPFDLQKMGDLVIYITPLFFSFCTTLRVILSQICGFRQLKSEVESVRKVAYSSDNEDHEKMLLEVS